MSDNKLQRKIPAAVTEKTQYGLAFGVIATMLYVAGFPMFIIIFFGIFAYFLWKTFSAPSAGGAREIFEFYLAANEILRDDDRRWFGFEIQETINRGERILQFMNGAPPLVYFTLGALYHKAGDHKSAVNHLAYILENDNADETKYQYATPELKNYVKTLREIEREPAKAPLTTAAIRSLERARRTRGKAILEESRLAVKEVSDKKREFAAEKKAKKLAEARDVSSAPPVDFKSLYLSQRTDDVQSNGNADAGETETKKTTSRKDSRQPRHQPISEVLRDIYDN